MSRVANHRELVHELTEACLRSVDGYSKIVFDTIPGGDYSANLARFVVDALMSDEEAQHFHTGHMEGELHVATMVSSCIAWHIAVYDQLPAERVTTSMSVDNFLAFLSGIRDRQEFLQMFRAFGVMDATRASKSPKECLKDIHHTLQLWADVRHDARCRHDDADEEKAKQARESLLAQIRENHKPHAEGTVAELATKLGVSKSEIRRRKADGTLDELIAQAKGE